MLKKITYINSAIAICVAIISVFYTFNESPEEFSSFKNWVIAFSLAAMFVVLVVGVTQLIGRAVCKAAETKWVFRLSIVVSAIWFLLSAILIEPLAYDSLYESYYNVSEFLTVGVMPLVIFWGLVWVAKSAIVSNQDGA